MKAPAAYFFVAAATASAALALGLAAGWLSLSALPDPDSWTLALLLRHAVRTGNWLHRIGRDASGDGTVVHWSHLVDAIALPFVLSLRPALGLERAITTVGTVFGPLSLGLLAAGLWWGVRPFAGWRPALLLIPAAVLTSPVLLAYGAAGEVFGHHLPLLACLVMGFAQAARAAMQQSPGTGQAVGAALWCGLAMWFSVEAAPFALIALGAVALVWVVDGTSPARRRMEAWVLAFFAAVATAWLLDPPDAGRAAVEADRLSLPFVVGAGLAAVAIPLAARLPRRTALSRMLTLASAGAAVFALWLALFPQLIHGVLPATTPEIWDYLWQRDNAARRLASPGFDLAFGFGALPALGLLAGELAPARGERRRLWLLAYALAATAALSALFFVHLRFAPYGAAAGVAAVAIIAARWRRTLGGAAAFAAGVLAILPALALVIDAAAPPQGPAMRACPSAEAARWLGGATGVVFADPRSGPELLWRTRAMTVATPYHRGTVGLQRWLRISRAVSDSEAEMALRSARVDFLLLCVPPPGVRPFYVAGLPETAIERWQRGRLPGWLREIERDEATGLVLLAMARD